MLSWALRVCITRAVLHLHGYIYRYTSILMLSLKFWNCLRVMPGSRLSSPGAAVGRERRPLGGCSGAVAARGLRRGSPAASASRRNLLLGRFLLNRVLQLCSCSFLSCLLHFSAIPHVVSFNIHIHIFSVLAGVYFTLTWGVFGC